MPSGLDTILVAWINQPNWAESKRFLQEHPALISKEADDLLVSLIQQSTSDQDSAVGVRVHRELITRCRAQDVDTAFADLLREEEVRLRKIVNDLKQPLMDDEMSSRIELIHQALKLVSSETSPRVLIQLLVKLGNCYFSLSARSPGDPVAMERAVLAYKEALEVCISNDLSSEGALVKAVLGDAYRAIGIRGQNIEKAINLYQEALQILRPDMARGTWIQTMRSLAVSYRIRELSNRMENTELAIAAYLKILQVLKPQAEPDAWADTMHDLGNTWMEHARAGRSEGFDRATEAYEAALSVITRNTRPDDWVHIIRMLGEAYSNRIHGNWAENCEQALSCYQSALEVLTREQAPDEWAEVLNNLANAYSKRIKGDQAENIELAKKAYESTLEVLTQEAMPEAWARTMNNLGALYLHRILGDSAQNNDNAITCFYAALDVRTSQEMPKEWAQTMHNLGSAYLERIKGNKADNLEKAIAAFESVVKVRTCELMPYEWAETTHNLAVAYFKRIVGDSSDNLSRAITYYKSALEVRKRETAPIEWSNSMHNLAIAYSALSHSWESEGFRLAVSTFNQALTVRTLDAMPREHMLTQLKLGDLYFKEQQWEEAYLAYRAAVEAVDLLYQSSATPTARQAELVESKHLAANLTYCLAKMHCFTEAVEIFERFKARGFSEILAREEARLQDVSNADSANFIEIRERIAILEAEERSVGRPGVRDFLAISADLREARGVMEAVANRISNLVPGFLQGSMSFSEIVNQSKDFGQPIVYLLTTSKGSLALIVRPEIDTVTEEQVIWLDGFVLDELISILSDRDDESRYLYGSAGGDTETLICILDQVWPVLKEELMAPLAKRLNKWPYEQAILISAASLSLLPLQAVLIDQIVFSMVPSAFMLKRALKSVQVSESIPPLLFAIGNPASNGKKALDFVPMEVEEVARVFPASARRSFAIKEITRALVINALSGVTHLHFSCHGIYDVDTPLESALLFSVNDRLTLHEILDDVLNLSSVRLVVLSACQTGINDYRNAPEEAIGFPAGFMQTGVPGVISTLWSVNDPSTAILMKQFYHYHIEEKQSPAKALNKAQQWLRDTTADIANLRGYYERLYQESGRRDVEALRWMQYYKANPNVKPFTHPYYWAGFILSGV